MVKKGSERADGNSSWWTNEWMDGMIHVWTEINQCSCNDLSFCILGGNNTNGLPAWMDCL